MSWQCAYWFNQRHNYWCTRLPPDGFLFDERTRVFIYIVSHGLFILLPPLEGNSRVPPCPVTECCRWSGQLAQLRTHAWLLRQAGKPLMTAMWGWGCRGARLVIEPQPLQYTVISFAEFEVAFCPCCREGALELTDNRGEHALNGQKSAWEECLRMWSRYYMRLYPP